MHLIACSLWNVDVPFFLVVIVHMRDILYIVFIQTMMIMNGTLTNEIMSAWILC